MRGARSIYVDYVDYDEIAHHAGRHPDRVAGRARRPRPGAGHAWRRSRSEPRGAITSSLLSDHGQSQGEPFASRYGIELSDLCRSLTQSETTGIEGSIEGWGRVDSVLEDLGGTGTTGAQQAASRRVDKVLKPEGADAERRRADRARRRQPGDGLRPCPRTAAAGGDRGPVARPDPRPRRPPGRRVRQRPERAPARSPSASTAVTTWRPERSRASTRCSRTATTRRPCSRPRP